MAVDIPSTAQAVVEALARELAGVEETSPRPPEAVRPHRAPRTQPTSPVLTFVERLPGTYFITTQVADLLGVSTHTVRRFAKARIGGAPSYMARFGKNQIALYTSDDVRLLASYLRESRAVLTRQEYDQVNEKYRDKFLTPKEIPQS